LKALVTSRSNSAFACSQRATAASYWKRRRRPWKTGVRSPAPIDQVRPAGKICETCGETLPKAPVRLMRGKKSAWATPTSALAATRLCSASRRSGRRRSRSEGSPGGTSGGRYCWSSVALRAIGPGLRPSRNDSSFSSATICRSISGTVAAVAASRASALLVSRAEAAPPWSRRLNRL